MIEEISASIEKGVLRWSKIYRFEHPYCSEAGRIKKGNLSELLVTLYTSKGDLTEIRYFKPV